MESILRAENGSSSSTHHSKENRTTIRNLFSLTPETLSSLGYHRNTERYQKGLLFIAPIRVEFSKSDYSLENFSAHVLT